jgi:hypothetical protein
MPKIFVQDPYYLKDLPVPNFCQDADALPSELLIVVLVVLQFFLAGRVGDSLEGTCDHARKDGLLLMAM